MIIQESSIRGRERGRVSCFPSPTKTANHLLRLGINNVPVHIDSADSASKLAINHGAIFEKSTFSLLQAYRIVNAEQ